jgi:hypothetical protein
MRVGVFACVAAAIVIAPSWSSASPAATDVAPLPKGAPFAVESCVVDASRALQRISLSLPLYDDAHVRKTVADASFAAMRLAPGESGEFRDEYVAVNLPSEVRRTLRAATCRFASATYEGGATWKPGKPWRGKLIPTNAGPSQTP